MFKTTQFLKRSIFVIFFLLSTAGFIVCVENNNAPVSKTDNLTKKTTDANLKYYNAGLIALQNNNHTAAIENFKKSIAENPDFTKAYDNLGLAFRLNGDYTNALKTYKISLQKNPDNPVTLQLLANLYLILKDQESSLATLKKLNKIKPNDPEILFSMGNVYSSMGRYNMARGFYLKAFDAYPANKPSLKSDALLSIGLNYFHKRNYTNATTYFNQAIQFDNKNNKTYYYLALTELLKTPPDLNKAQTFMTRAVLLGFPASEEILAFFNLEEKPE